MNSDILTVHENLISRVYSFVLYLLSLLSLISLRRLQITFTIQCNLYIEQKFTSLKYIWQEQKLFLGFTYFKVVQKLKKFCIGFVLHRFWIHLGYRFHRYFFWRGYLPNPFRQIWSYLPEPFWQIRSYMPEPLRQISIICRNPR